MKPMSISLTYPISIDNTELSTLSLRRPKVRDMLAVEKSAETDAEKELQLFANLCTLRPDDLHELDMVDYTKLQKAYQDFLS